MIQDGREGGGCLCVCLGECPSVCLCVIEGKEITTANIFTGHTMLLSHCEVFKWEIINRLPSYYRWNLPHLLNMSIHHTFTIHSSFIL